MSSRYGFRVVGIGVAGAAVVLTGPQPSPYLTPTSCFALAIQSSQTSFFLLSRSRLAISCLTSSRDLPA